MIQDRRKLVQGVLGPAESEKAEVDPEKDALHACCEELIAAVHAKDVDGVKEALRAAVHACNGGEIGG